MYAVRGQLLIALLLEALAQGCFTSVAISCSRAILVSWVKIPRLLTVAFVALFGVTVVTFVGDIVVFLGRFEADIIAPYPLNLTRPIICLRVFNCALSSSLVAFRCYQLWPHRILVTALNIVLVLGTFVVGIVCAARSEAWIDDGLHMYNWTSIASTAVQGGIVAGRTVWMKWQLHKLCGMSHYTKTGLFVDSAITYPVLVLIDQLVSIHPIQAALAAIAGITGGHIILQAAEGKNSRDIESLLKEFCESERSSTPILDTLFGSFMDPAMLSPSASRVSQVPHQGTRDAVAESQHSTQCDGESKMEIHISSSLTVDSVQSV
ncbi:hypothetical protein FA15DRAFT_438228 [Coprinopsis marcescibilis]|uniref:Integral membrane protein n=1 Tax=Coprinopsis marcescibilis TaxID=230819 RepID=A0A5C3KVZ1_COPMA|nr:hypothetical protein FA15DRAFT_438228 [Coprinopsis marcescibilis]